MPSDLSALRPQAGDAFDVRVVAFKGVMYLELIGDLDSAGVETLSIAIERFLAKHQQRCCVALDLAELTFLDTRGVRAVAAACELLLASGFPVSIHSVGRYADRIVETADAGLGPD